MSTPVPPSSGPSIEGPELSVTYFTDPLCVWSWAFEPVWRRLLHAYEGRIRWRYAMGGMIPPWRDYRDPLNDVERPLHLGALSRQASEIGGVPIADRIWVEDPPASSYPACIAVKAAELRSLEAGDLYLRRVREAGPKRSPSHASSTTWRAPRRARGRVGPERRTRRGRRALPDAGAP